MVRSVNIRVRRYSILMQLKADYPKPSVEVYSEQLNDGDWTHEMDFYGSDGYAIASASWCNSGATLTDDIPIDKAKRLYEAMRSLDMDAIEAEYEKLLTEV